MKKMAIYAVGLIVMLASCASPQARYYHLTPVADAPVANTGKASPATVSIGPVSIPDRLDRSQIVTLSSANEVQIAQFDRWAGNINDEIVRAMTKNISILLPGTNIVPFEMEKWVYADYQVRVDILQMDAVMGKTVKLSACYTITDKNRKTLLLKNTDITEAAGSGYAEIVKAQSIAVGDLSSQIADALDTVISAAVR